MGELQVTDHVHEGQVCSESISASGGEFKSGILRWEK